MKVLIVTDNYYYMQGLQDVVDLIYYFPENVRKGKRAFPHISSEDWIMLSLSSLEDMYYFYDYYKTYSRAKIIICLDFKFSTILSEINNIFFLSAHASVQDIENIFYGKKYSARKRYLTQREEMVMSLMLEGWALKEIAASLGLSIKTVSLHKSHINEKSGLINNNDIALLSLMFFVPLSISKEVLYEKISEISRKSEIERSTMYHGAAVSY
ncbi:helix-turn-helix transcriptional regulator [Pluralibacter gergoviae]